jgi:hypothetical protein
MARLRKAAGGDAIVASSAVRSAVRGRGRCPPHLTTSSIAYISKVVGQRVGESVVRAIKRDLSKGGGKRENPDLEFCQVCLEVFVEGHANMGGDSVNLADYL